MLRKELVEVMDWPGKRITRDAAIVFTCAARASRNGPKPKSERDRSAIEDVIGELQAPSNTVPFSTPPILALLVVTSSWSLITIHGICMLRG